MGAEAYDLGGLDWLSFPEEEADPYAEVLSAFLDQASAFDAGAGNSLLDFVPRISPRYKRPDHLLRSRG